MRTGHGKNQYRPVRAIVPLLYPRVQTATIKFNKVSFVQELTFSITNKADNIWMACRSLVLKFPRKEIDTIAWWASLCFVVFLHDRQRNTRNLIRSRRCLPHEELYYIPGIKFLSFSEQLCKEVTADTNLFFEAKWKDSLAYKTYRYKRRRNANFVDTPIRWIS